MIPCPNCTHDTEEWDDHYGAQGWLCEASSEKSPVTA